MGVPSRCLPFASAETPSCAQLGVISEMEPKCPLRPVKRLIKAKPAIEGAGVRNGTAVNRLPAFVRSVGQLQPTTLRLTAERLIAASRCKHKTYTREKPIILEFGGDFGGTPDASSVTSFRDARLPFTMPYAWMAAG